MPGKQGNPWLAADDQTLYFDTGTGDTEIFRTTRPSRDAPFGTPQQLTELTSPNEDTALMLAGDDRLAVYSSSRPGSQSFDLYLVERPDPASPFGTPEQANLVQVNSSANEVDPFLTTDARTLVFAQSGNAGQSLMISTRPQVSDKFGPPSRLMGTGTFPIEADPDLSPDALVLAFAAIDGQFLQLFAAVRSTTDAAFGTPFRLTDLAGNGVDGDPAFSSDGCELIWVSDRGGNRDLYRATVVR